MPPFMCDIETDGATYDGAVAFSSCFPECTAHVSAYYSLGMFCSRWDNSCCEGEEWQKAAGVADLQKVCEQTFYHLLVDAKDWEASWERPPVAYVAEELLDAPEVS